MPLPPELSQAAAYAAPPLVGAFIGYLTNRIAIRMLFRPLKAWRVLGLRVPMTPGVIPSKRHALANNIGQMVGSHLLTSKEIGAALHRDSFQDHLRQVISERGDDFLARDLGPLRTVIPERFTSYLDVAVQALVYQIQEGLQAFVDSPRFAALVEQGVEGQLERILARELGEYFDEQERAGVYAFMDQSLARFVDSPAMENWLAEFVRHKLDTAVSAEQSLAELLPDSIQDLIGEAIEAQTPSCWPAWVSCCTSPGSGIGSSPG